MNEQLIQAAETRIAQKMDAAERINGEAFDTKEIALDLRNTRTVNIRMIIPKEESGEPPFYTYSYLNFWGTNDKHSLRDLAIKILEIGYNNDDISGHTPDGLIALGFVPEEGTNLCAISNMLRPDNYRLELTDEISYGQTHYFQNQGFPNSASRDVFKKENLTIFGKVIAHRSVYITTEYFDTNN